MPRCTTNGYVLTTAEIIYHLPDYPSVLQTFVWQHLDLAPGYPRLHRFLDYWSRNLDGKLHSVRVAGARLDAYRGLRRVEQIRRLH